MQITLRYFAGIREIVGVREEQVEVPAGATVATVWAQLVERFPSLENQRYRPAVNQEYGAPADALKDGDELVFVPPVSGGARPVRGAGHRPPGA